jgi:hypothetical protein
MLDRQGTINNNLGYFLGDHRLESAQGGLVTVLANLLAVPKMRHTSLNLVIHSADIIVNVHDTQGVGEARARLPAGDDDDRIAALDEAARLAELDAELDAAFDVLHPVGVGWV